MREKIKTILTENKIVAGLELLIIPLALVLKAVGVIKNPSLALFLFGWLSLWLRRSGWKQMGLNRPANWKITVLMAIVLALAYNALDIFVFLPLLHRLTGEPLVLGTFGEFKNNLRALLTTLTLVWPLSAFIEEMAFRGYALNRLMDVFGKKTISVIISVLLTSVAFGLGHGAEGITGILDNIIAGSFFAILYLRSGKNLWLPILTHGIIDTSSLILLFLGFRL